MGNGSLKWPSRSHLGAEGECYNMSQLKSPHSSFPTIFVDVLQPPTLLPHRHLWLLPPTSAGQQISAEWKRMAGYGEEYQTSL